MRGDERGAAGFADKRLALLVLIGLLVAVPVLAAEPIKIGFSAQQTGSTAGIGRAILLAVQIWAEDVNAAGGLLGRPVQLVYYDDQSNPALVPSIYTKLVDVDRVDLLIASGTNFSTPAMPTIIEHNMLIMDMFALAVNEHFKYPRFFQIMPYGPNGKESISHGYFAAAMTMSPKPKTIALIGADAEFSKAALDGARAQAKRLGLEIVYDRTYPPATIDYGPIVRSVQSAEADLVFVASYPADTAGILRAAAELGLKAKMFGGPMVGLQYAAMKSQLGEQLNGIVSYELYVREPTMQFPGVDAFLAKYQSRAAAAGVDALGYYTPPFTYAALDILRQAVEATHGVDQGKLADYIHHATFKTLVGDIKFGPDGEWAEPRMLTIQYQHVKGHELEQFTHPGTQVILDPPEFATGKLEYPYSEARGQP
jgi:branched-chain amino acid transport system substrate-binding protein